MDNWSWIDDQTIGEAATDISPDEEFAARITGRTPPADTGGYRPEGQAPGRPFDQLSANFRPSPGSPLEGLPGELPVNCLNWLNCPKHPKIGIKRRF